MCQGKERGSNIHEVHVKYGPYLTPNTRRIKGYYIRLHEREIEAQQNEHVGEL